MKNDIFVTVRQILDSYLEVNNHRKTPERYAVLKAVYSMKGHFSLKELSHQLEENNFLVSRATLYNTMKLFQELRLVICHRLQGITKYEACYNKDSHCHQICTICGKVVEIEAPNILQALEDTKLKRFRKDGFVLYVYGVCSTCQAKLTRKKTLVKRKY
jgi:Fur family ferric uptake transcriptional regulator